MPGPFGTPWIPLLPPRRRLNETAELNPNSYLGKGVRAVWRFGRDSIYPVKGSIGGTPSLVTAGTTFPTGILGPGINWNATTSAAIDTGLKPAAFGIDGVKSRTVFFIIAQPDTAPNGGIFCCGSNNNQQDFSVNRSGAFRRYGVNLWGGDFATATDLGAGGNAYQHVYVVVTYDGVNVKAYGAIGDTQAAMIDLGGTLAVTLNTDNANNVFLGSGGRSGAAAGIGLNTYLIGVAGGVAWSLADANRWFADPFGMLRPATAKTWGIAAGGATFQPAWAAHSNVLVSGGIAT